MKNIINDILNPESDKDGLMKKEFEAYKEMMSGSWKSDSPTLPEGGHILEFSPIKEDNFEKHNGNDLVIYAADSESKIEKPAKKTSFFTLKDNNYILKVDEKRESGKKKVTASLISSDSSGAIHNCLLYCAEINKHFIIDSDNEIFIGYFNENDFDSFLFSLTIPKAKITLILKDDGNENPTINAISDSSDCKVMDTKTGKENFVIEINFSGSLKAIVYRNKIHSDFLTAEGNKIIIPQKLLANKSRILIY